MKEDYERRVNFSSGLVFISLGLSNIVTGLLMNRFAEKFCKFKLAIVGTFLVELATFASLICYFLKSYPVCFVCAALWGISETFLKTNNDALISKIFPNKVEAFSVYRIFFSIGAVAVFVLGIALSQAPGYIYLIIIIVIKVIISILSLNLKDLDN